MSFCTKINKPAGSCYNVRSVWGVLLCQLVWGADPAERALGSLQVLFLSCSQSLAKKSDLC